MSKNVFWVVAPLPQRLKSMFFEIFSHFASLFGPLLGSKFFQKTLILALDANSALSCENETKIVKITHSAYHYQPSFILRIVTNFVYPSFSGKSQMF